MLRSLRFCLVIGNKLIFDAVEIEKIPNLFLFDWTDPSYVKLDQYNIVCLRYAHHGLFLELEPISLQHKLDTYHSSVLEGISSMEWRGMNDLSKAKSSNTHGKRIGFENYSH